MVFFDFFLIVSKDNFNFVNLLKLLRSKQVHHCLLIHDQMIILTPTIEIKEPMMYFNFISSPLNQLITKPNKGEVAIIV